MLKKRKLWLKYIEDDGYFCFCYYNCTYILSEGAYIFFNSTLHHHIRQTLDPALSQSPLEGMAGDSLADTPVC